jgi:site-specific recombinase XerD
MEARIRPGKPAVSCVGCFAWGILPGRRCRSCSTFDRLHEPGGCAGCSRTVAVKKGYCRLCWLQARLQVRALGRGGVRAQDLRQVCSQQLFFFGMHRIRQPGPPLGKQGRRPTHPQPSKQQPHLTGWVQLRLPIDVRRDYARFDRHLHADLANPTLVQARHAARTLGEAHGWSHWLAKEVDRALVIALSGHTAGDPIRLSELAPVLRRRGLAVERTAEVLDHLGLLDDDRTPAFEGWLDRKLHGMTPGIRRDVEHWLRTLRSGGPRTHARSPETIWSYLNGIHPILLSWSQRHDHLREVARDDVLSALDPLHGSGRRFTLSVLRSLFRHCKQTGTIFRDPTLRIRHADNHHGVLQPLQPADVQAAIAAATTPATRLALVLAAVHAARTKDIRELRLQDVDLGNRRLVIAGRARPLDQLTYQALIEWLEHRRAQWPNTANPHLLVNRLTAVKTTPVGKVWLTKPFWGLEATLERLHADRQLEESLVQGPDPLHLAAVFGVHYNTAIRYANAARQLLTTMAEEQAPASPPNPRTETPHRA